MILEKIFVEFLFPLFFLLASIGYLFDTKEIINMSLIVGVLLNIAFIIKNKCYRQIKFSYFKNILIPMIIFDFCILVISFFSVDINTSFNFADHYFKWMAIPFIGALLLGYTIGNKIPKLIFWSVLIWSLLTTVGIYWNSIVEGNLRAISFFIKFPNAAAGSLAFILPFVLLNKQINNKYINMLLSLLIIYAIFLTGSRGAFLATAFMLILLCTFKYYDLKKLLVKKYVYLAIAVLVVFFNVINIDLSTRYTEIFKNSDELIENRIGGDRLLLWRSSIEMIKDYPITGVGLHNFNKVYIENGYISDYAKEPNLMSPHNLVLHIFVETGLIGICSFLFLIYSQFKFLSSFIKKDDFVLAYFLAIVVMLVHGMVDYLFLVKDFYQLYWFLWGCICIYIYKVMSKTKEGHSKNR